MKKTMTIIALILAFALSLTACGGLKFATGGTSGTYYPYGGAVANVVKSAYPDIDLKVQATGASSANIRLIASGEADMAIVQNDVMDYAYNGTELFNGEKIDKFLTVATIYAEVCQVIVSASSGIESVADLKGKSVSVGDMGSGVEVNSKQILEAYGLSFDDIKVQNLSFGDSATAMKDGKIDAFFVTAGIPTTAVMELVSTHDIKLLALDSDKIDALMNKYPFYTEYTIPADSYSGVSSSVNTVAVKATLIVNPELDETTVYNITKAIFEGKDDISATHEKGKELDVNSAVKGVTVPFHPGAEKYFKEIGAMS